MKSTPTVSACRSYFGGSTFFVRCLGVLPYKPASLDLEIGERTCHIDFDQPYDLAEYSTFGPANMPLQVLLVRQGDKLLGLSYGLALGHKPVASLPGIGT
jgi:hypothetical protein